MYYFEKTIEKFNDLIIEHKDVFTEDTIDKIETKLKKLIKFIEAGAIAR